MHDDSLCLLSAARLRALYARREVSPVDAVKAFAGRIDRINSAVNAVVTLDLDRALDAARIAEQQLMTETPLPPLHGLPLSVKDNILTAGIRSTLGSALFRDFVPTEDSGVVTAAKRAGAIVLAKTNTPAFGWTGTTDNKVFGPTKNPFDLTRTPGGSSGGAAVAAALGLAALHVGTDGGGSLRIPSAFTGTIGFKPSHGRIPDVPPHTHWLFQHYGPIARDVEDIRLVYESVAGPDPRDPHSLPAGSGPDAFFAQAADRKPRVLFTTQLGYIQHLDPEVASICRSAANAFREVGWDVVERDLSISDPSPFANVIAGFGLLARLKGHEDRTSEIEDGILSIISSVRSLPNTAFYDAYFARNTWCAGMLELFEEIDLLVTPAAACLPFELGRLFPADIGGKAAPASAWTPYLRPFNITGQPAISIPAGYAKNGLPVGLQIVGPRFGDRLVLEAATVFERIRPWNKLAAIEALDQARQPA